MSRSRRRASGSCRRLRCGSLVWPLNDRPGRARLALVGQSRRVPSSSLPVPAESHGARQASSAGATSPVADVDWWLLGWIDRLVGARSGSAGSRFTASTRLTPVLAERPVIVCVDCIRHQSRPSRPGCGRWAIPAAHVLMDRHLVQQSRRECASGAGREDGQGRSVIRPDQPRDDGRSSLKTRQRARR